MSTPSPYILTVIFTAGITLILIKLIILVILCLVIEYLIIRFIEGSWDWSDLLGYFFSLIVVSMKVVNTAAILIFFLLANVTFPGSFNLVSEILALINIVWNNSFFCFSFLVAGLFSCYYWFLILNRKLPYHCCSSSLNWIEWFLFFWLLVLIYFLGFLLILFLIVRFI